jgi:hypothetical protein
MLFHKVADLVLPMVMDPELFTQQVVTVEVVVVEMNKIQQVLVVHQLKVQVAQELVMEILVDFHHLLFQVVVVVAQERPEVMLQHQLVEMVEMEQTYLHLG